MEYCKVPSLVVGDAYEDYAGDEHEEGYDAREYRQSRSQTDG